MIKESDDMLWFNSVNIRQVKDNVSKKNYQWDWEVTSQIFILADDIFESLMLVDSSDFEFSSNLLEDIQYILTGKKATNNSPDVFDVKEYSHISLYSLKDKSFQNKSSMAKSCLLIGSAELFKSS